MANVTFILKEPKSTDDTLVYLVFHFQNQKLKYSTGQKINPQFWNKKNHRVKETRLYPDYPEFNSFLNNFETKTQSFYRRLINDGIDPNPEKLRTQLDAEFYKTNTENKKDFLTFISSFITISSNKPGTIKHYKQTEKRLKEYKAGSGKALLFEDIDLNFYEKFKNFCVEAKYGINTIGGYIKDIKTFMGAAFDRKLTANVDFKNKKFKKLEEEVETIYLNNKDLHKLIKYDLKNNARLDKVRDLFLIGCYTGLRYSDLVQLNEKNLIEKNTKLKIKTNKTGDILIIPLNSFVRNTIKKYNGTIPLSISNVKMNEYIKELAELAKVNESVQITTTKGGQNESKEFKKYQLITVHTARRTFATNAFLMDMPTISIMKITGHKTEKSFMKYIKITQEDNANKLILHPFFK